MKFNTLKKTNISISEIGLGTNAVGGHNLFTNLNEEEGKQMVAKALDLGITFIDTADIYGKGRSEELVGDVLSSFNREDYIIATKGANHWFEDGTVKIDNHPAYLREAFENSLKRLKMDYVDLYYLHFPDNVTPLAESIGELSKLKQEGKIKAIGVSNLTLEQLKEANVHNDISALQSAYNMLERSAEEDLLPYCVEHNISFIPYGPLAFGLLGGHYTNNFELSEGDWRQSVPLFKKGTFENVLKKVEFLKDFASKKETNVANLALAWLLAQDGIDSVIPGGKRKAQVEENVKASDVVLSQHDLKEIEAILK